MHTILLIVHIFVCVTLILIVLLQAGRGGGMGIFGGGGGSDALFSAPSGSAFLKKATTIIAIIFIITSVGLTYFASHKGMKTITGSIQPRPAPAQPVAPLSDSSKDSAQEDTEK